MGHEVAHALADHGVECMSETIGAQAVGQILSAGSARFNPGLRGDFLKLCSRGFGGRPDALRAARRAQSRSPTSFSSPRRRRDERGGWNDWNYWNVLNGSVATLQECSDLGVYFRSEVQNAHRVALRGIADRQCGQSLVVGAGAGPGFCIRLICLTNKKIANAMITKLIM